MAVAGRLLKTANAGRGEPADPKSGISFCLFLQVPPSLMRLPTANLSSNKEIQSQKPDQKHNVHYRTCSLTWSKHGLRKSKQRIFFISESGLTQPHKLQVISCPECNTLSLVKTKRVAHNLVLHWHVTTGESTGLLYVKKGNLILWNEKSAPLENGIHQNSQHLTTLGKHRDDFHRKSHKSVYFSNSCNILHTITQI